MLRHGLLRIPSIPVCDAAETTGMAQHSRKKQGNQSAPKRSNRSQGAPSAGDIVLAWNAAVNVHPKVTRDLSMANSQSMAVSYSKDYQVKL